MKVGDKVELKPEYCPPEDGYCEKDWSCHQNNTDPIEGTITEITKSGNLRVNGTLVPYQAYQRY